MKEYRVIKTGEREVERVMNDMARQGWEVADVTYWSYWWTHLLITFVREAGQTERQS